MAENDFFVMNGNRYRGSRYANFAGGGTDAQGNITSAINENAANQTAQSGNRPNINPTEVPQQTAGVGVMPPAPPEPPKTIGQQAKDLAIGAALPMAATTIGSAAGTSLATNVGFGDALDMSISGAINKVSGGLLGTASSSTNAALASMGGKLGPATQSAVSKAGAGAGVGGAIGSGLGTAAATLLTGGKFKDAAIGGIGAGVGYALGNAIMPGVGGFIGSTLGSMVSGMFGGDMKRQSVSGDFQVDKDGRYYAAKTGGKGTKNEQQSKYAGSITNILNSFADAVGLKYTSGFYTHSNIGKKDQKTAYITHQDHVATAEKQKQAAKKMKIYPGMRHGPMEAAILRKRETGGKVSHKTISKTPGDVGAVALKTLQNSGLYQMGEDQQINDWWTQNVGKAQNITQLGQMVDEFLASRNNGPSRSLIAVQNEGRSKYNFAT